MKIRKSFVSNSSSSSFIIFGPNAEEFVKKIGCGELLNPEYMADTIWEHYIYNECKTKIRFYVDVDWKKKFEDLSIGHRELPISIYNGNAFDQDLRGYEDEFIVWFCKNYPNLKMYEIEFSDHDGETKYNEMDMFNIMSGYKDKEQFHINNH